jgi:hypothetical protein
VQLSQEIFKINVRVSQSPLQRKAVDFGMKGKHDDPAVGMTHLDVTAFAMNLNETEALES